MASLQSTFSLWVVFYVITTILHTDPQSGEPVLIDLGFEGEAKRRNDEVDALQQMQVEHNKPRSTG